MNWYLAVIKKYADFSGRARRKEYWMFVLFNAIISVILNILERATLSSQDPSAVFSNPFYLISLVYGLAVLLPSLAVTVRRLHDTNRNGWTIFLALIPLVGAIILLVYECQDGTPGENKYGPNPKDVAPQTI
jgi:uncharacterized membrane protein YhaH (DUF805 family)